MFYACLGEIDNAFEWLQKGYDQHDHFIHQMKVEPLWDPLRSDSRFQALLRKMNFLEWNMFFMNPKKMKTAKIINHFEKFLDLWKNADPGIAKVDDARERLAGIQNR